MKRLTYLTIIVALMLLPLAAFAQKPETPPGPPESGSGMYPLWAIYDYFVNGITPPAPGEFQGPPAGPGPMQITLKDMYEDFKALIDQCTARPDQVLDTVEFFNTDPANWGPQAGTIPTQGDVTGPEGTKTFPIPDGYYHGKTATAQDAELVAGNIKSGVDIFGVSGDPNVVDTSSGDAVAGEILSGKTAWVDGSEVTGTIATQTVDNSTVSQAAGYYNAFNLSTVDTDLAAEKIKSGVDIFGVTGTLSAGGSAAVPKTGQTTCYDASGTVISCTGTGQDGDLQKGVACPSPRFTDNTDGTVTDNLTGLIWLKDASCTTFYTGDSTGQNRRNWTNALMAANSLAHGFCSLTDSSSAGDWRLPNVRELFSLIDHSQPTGLPYALPSGHPFGVHSNHYWSSTTYVRHPFAAWLVNIDEGYVHGLDKAYTGSVWPVRGGE